MPDAIVDQFRGLPMSDLIGAPLDAACEAQIKLANATANFIQVVGFMPPEGDSKTPTQTRTASFKFKRPQQQQDKTTGPLAEEEVEITVPLLSIVNVPNLSIKSVDITFDMEVKSATSSVEKTDKQGSFSAEASIGWGIFSAKASVSGSISSHKENTRSTDTSAKYHVEVHASDAGMPEGLARVMDILQTACAPKAITPAAPKPVTD
ncbi:DUF2589 domain-containing protein [Maridesulfovibrio sp. FT414]|uniref:DUF2589 domain-containing protein n=1 Tax=Maridesulfovibrio sp. FT414 TaxID=2979469 RepID=UPI003D80671B